MAAGTDITKSFADRLSDLIYQKRKEGKSFKEIAEESGVPTGSLSKYQNDACEAGISSLIKLATYFDVSTDYLLGLSDVATGNADDMAIEKRLGLNDKTINHLRRFIDEDSGYCHFLNILSETEFWDIIIDLQNAFYIFKEAMEEENLAVLNNQEVRKKYEGGNLPYNRPTKKINELGFNLSLGAEEYFNYCLQQACRDLDYVMSWFSTDYVHKVQIIPNIEDIVMLKPTRRKKKKEQQNG
jgi:transcriptional regulator with XRE-family HTH domain